MVRCGGAGEVGYVGISSGAVWRGEVRQVWFDKVRPVPLWWGRCGLITSGKVGSGGAGELWPEMVR